MDLATRVGGLGDSVRGFGNEGVAFDEGVIGERLGSADAEPDERQRNPVVQFLDNTCVAENDLVHDDVVSVFPVIGHGTPPRFVGFDFLEEEERTEMLRFVVFLRRETSGRIRSSVSCARKQAAD